jgi:hypothetical protein
MAAVIFHILQVALRIRIESRFNRVSGSGSGSRSVKMTHKNRTKLRNLKFHVLKFWMSAEGFFCSLNFLYGDLGISKLQFFTKYILKNVLLSIFFNFWSSKPWIWIGIQLKMLDPDTMNPDPKHCLEGWTISLF